MKKKTSTALVVTKTHKLTPAAAWGEASLRVLQKRVAHMNLVSRGVIPGRVRMTLDQFEVRLASIEAQYAIAFESAKTIATYGASAEVVAKQRRMNMMVELMILQLEEESGITVAVHRGEENVNQVPFPPRINRLQSVLSWQNNR